VAGDAALNRVVGVSTSGDAWDANIDAGALDPNGHLGPDNSFSFTSLSVASRPVAGRVRALGSLDRAGYVELNHLSLGNALVLPGSTSVSFTPLLGSDGRWYANLGGTTAVHALSSTLVPLYPVTSAGVVDDKPNLDCNRVYPGKGGVLYLRGARTITGWIIDDQGLNTTAPWPRYQHDARNSGNANVPITLCP
jgi:hypothetical protein